MYAWEAIQKTLDTIENHIGNEIQIEELADTAALSVFYYQRLFSRLVKKPVREYIKLRRLARACEALRDTDKRILDIALDYGFGSHESFTRTFKDAYSMTPTEYRETDIRLNNFDKPDLLLNYTMVDLGVPLISEGLVIEMNRIMLEKPVNFMGVKRYCSISGLFPNGEVTGINEPGEVWRLFGEVEDEIPCIPSGRKIGVAYHDDTSPEGCFPYFVGAEIEPTTITENHDTWALPAAAYLVCRWEAESFEELVSAALNKALKFGHMWKNKHDLKQTNFGAEIYYPEDEEDYFYMEMWSLWVEEGGKCNG